MSPLLLLPLLALTATARAEGRFTAEQLAARDYTDLGPKEVETTSYPKEQRENYRIFLKACSSCHTAARAVNSPLVTREDWTRCVKRMFHRSKTNAGAAIGRDDAKAAIDFMAYDSNIRKVKDAPAFKVKTAELKALFEEVRKERSRLQLEGK